MTFRGPAAAESFVADGEDDHRQWHLIHLARRLGHLVASEEDRRDLGSDRTWRLLIQHRWFEAWTIVWPPDGSIDLHDHGTSSGAVFVARGELTESRIRGHEGVLRTVERRLHAGAAVGLPPSCIHDVTNTSAHPAVSIHVYAPRLRSMTFYRLDGGILSPVRECRYDGTEPMIETEHHGRAS